MLPPTAREWDEYFSLCKVGERNHEVALARLRKLRQCIDGVLNEPDPDIDVLRRFLLANQLSPLHEIAMFTGVGPDRIKEVFFENRDKFFVFRTGAEGDETVYYSALEPEIPERPKKKAIQLRRMMVARWMRLRGFIEPYYVHQPLGMSIDCLCLTLNNMGYRREVVEFGDGDRPVYFENSYRRDE